MIFFNLRRALFLASMALASLPLEVIAGTYKNDEFGFEVHIPPKHPICASAPYQHDHGIVVYLDTGASECINSKKRPFIGIFGNYNSSFVPSLDELIVWQCSGEEGAVSYNDYRFDVRNLQTRNCRIERNDGWVDIFVVGQAGVWPGERITTDDESPYINYIFQLHARADSLGKELLALTSMLRAIKILKSN